MLVVLVLALTSCIIGHLVSHVAFDSSSSTLASSSRQSSVRSAACMRATAAISSPKELMQLLRNGPVDRSIARAAAAGF